MTDALSDSKTAEAANAVAVAHEATINALEALLTQSELRIAEKTQIQVKESIEHAFFVPDELGKQRKFIDITQIPRICDDIRTIKNSMWWMSRIAAVVGTIIFSAGAWAISRS